MHYWKSFFLCPFCACFRIVGQECPETVAIYTEWAHLLKISAILSFCETILYNFWKYNWALVSFGLAELNWSCPCMIWFLPYGLYSVLYFFLLPQFSLFAQYDYSLAYMLLYIYCLQLTVIGSVQILCLSVILLKLQRSSVHPVLWEFTLISLVQRENHGLLLHAFIWYLMYSLLRVWWDV